MKKNKICFHCGSGRILERMNKSLFPFDNVPFRFKDLSFIYDYPIKYCPACGEAFISPKEVKECYNKW